MAFKFLLFAAFLAVARAGVIGVAAPAYSAAPAVSYSTAPVAKTIIAEPSAPANYEFGYAVNDPHTDDSKSHQETRHGDVVQGSYSLIEADGSKRVVHYTVDAHSGFNAVVSREPGSVAVKAVAPVVAKVAAPIVTKLAAPLGYAAGPAYYH
ncbi:cuticle protein-like [Anoplophora glabripennis]|uniref:cuticle protein-like n=1 Tax=Anoplophora glabripennis TaxID=217634 RepID=UPI000C78E837|nr:cuticle protein-like [Anoplophora glabripennis]